MNQKISKERRSKVIIYLSLLISVEIIILGTFLFWIAYHNIDLGQNMRYINAEYGLDLVETSSVSAVKVTSVDLSPEELYSSGVQQLLLSYFILALGWCLFGAIITISLDGVEK